MLKKNGHGKAVDWYLLGVLLYEMVTGLPPYYADDKDQLFKNILKDKLNMQELKANVKVSKECIDLLTRVSLSFFCLNLVCVHSSWRKIQSSE